MAITTYVFTNTFFEIAKFLLPEIWLILYFIKVIFQLELLTLPTPIPDEE